MNYPNGIKKSSTKVISHKNRGMDLEYDINISNTYYLEHDIAVIHKKPTPIQIVDVSYPSRNKAKIVEAYFKTPSTTDYNGVYKGYYLDFEAKETKSKTSFALNNIHTHQIKHLENVLRHKGIAFLIIGFTSLEEIYLLPAKSLIDFINTNQSKSIPINTIRKEGYEIEMGFSPRIDYLKVIDKLLEGYNERRLGKYQTKI